MVDINFTNGVVIFLIMFICNFIGATTGGSGLLTIPACIFLGFSPQTAVATTRVGVLFSTIASGYGFSRGGKIDYKIGIVGSACSAMGAIIGAYVMVNISSVLLGKIIGSLMLTTLVFTVVKTRFLKNPQHIFLHRI